MTPPLSVPTDNIYKFSCLFGLALIISSIFAFVSTYSSSLDRKIKYAETVIPLEAKTQRSKADDELLALNKKLIEITKSNESAALSVISVVLVAGLMLSMYGALKWHRVIQERDDMLATLQLKKLEIEVAKLQRELAQQPTINELPKTEESTCEN